MVVIGARASGLFTRGPTRAPGISHSRGRTPGQGGRACLDHRGRHGFKVNDGAIVIEVGGITEQTFAEVGAGSTSANRNHPSCIGSQARTSTSPGGGWDLLLGKLTRQGAKLAKESARPSDSGLPEDRTVHRRLGAQIHQNDGVHGIFHRIAPRCSPSARFARTGHLFFTRRAPS